MKNKGVIILLLLLPVLINAQQRTTFEINGKQFLLNGKPFQILAGELLYSRIPEEYWKDRLLKARALGLNAVCTYMFWNFHEPNPGQFNLNKTGDSYLDMRTWCKGFVIVNGHNLGRFWNVGPQFGLYLPGVFLKQGKNQIIVFDMYKPSKATIKGDKA